MTGGGGNPVAPGDGGCARRMAPRLRGGDGCGAGCDGMGIGETGWVCWISKWAEVVDSFVRVPTALRCFRNDGGD